jgi:hypothetical protein
VHHDSLELPAPARPPSPWLGAGLRTALVAAAATGGVLVRFGVATGIGAWEPFTQVGRLALGVAVTDGPWVQRAALLVGLLLHLGVTTLWTVLFAALAARWRGVWRWGAAVVVSFMAFVADQAIMPAVLRLGHGARDWPPQVVLLHVVLALALVVGMRLALDGVRDDR